MANLVQVLSEFRVTVKMDLS